MARTSGAAELEHEEHVRAPLADALHGGQLGDRPRPRAARRGARARARRDARARPASAGTSTFARDRPAAARISSGSASRISLRRRLVAAEVARAAARGSRAPRAPTAAGRRSSARARRSGRRAGDRARPARRRASSSRASTGSAARRCVDAASQATVGPRARRGSPSSALSARSTDAEMHVNVGVSRSVNAEDSVVRSRWTRSRKRRRVVGLERDDELLVVEAERVASC